MAPEVPLPYVDIVVPVHNEGHWMADKLGNLRALDYPASHLRVLVVDGGSTDGTLAAAESWQRSHGQVTLVRCAQADKTAQLNAALRNVQADWVLVTDADARLDPATVRQLVAVAQADPGAVVIGAPVRLSRGAHALDRLHWEIINGLRRWEYQRGCSSMVTAPCYLFRRDVLRAFPDDVIADDVHVAFAAMAQGWRVAMSDAEVMELRSPGTAAGLLAHKVRKADAYVREVLRFVPRLADMVPSARAVFLFRAMLLVIVPVIALGGAAILAAWCVSATGLITGTALILGALGVVPILLIFQRRPIPGVRYAALAILLLVTMWIVLASYPFRRQTAAFLKVTVRAAPGFGETP